MFEQHAQLFAKFCIRATIALAAGKQYAVASSSVHSRSHTNTNAVRSCAATRSCSLYKHDCHLLVYLAQGTNGGEAIQFGAARDSQTAADTAALSGNVSTGAATFSFIQAIEQGGPYLTYGQLLFNMDATLNKMNGKASSGGMPSFSSINPFDPIGSVQGLLGSGGASAGQTPIMSSNTPFDFNRQFHI